METLWISFLDWMEGFLEEKPTWVAVAFYAQLIAGIIASLWASYHCTETYVIPFTDQIFPHHFTTFLDVIVGMTTALIPVMCFGLGTMLVMALATAAIVFPVTILLGLLASNLGNKRESA